MIKGDVTGQREQPTDNNYDYKEDPNFDRNLDRITDGAQPHFKKHLLEKISRINAAIIVAYILAFETEVNPALTYRLDTISKLKMLAEFHDPSSPGWQMRHKNEIRGLSKEQILECYKAKSFYQMTRQDFIEFLDRLRKPDSEDPTHGWIGTRESNRILLRRFFKWLYYPDIDFRNRPDPPVIKNIPQIKRKEKDEDIYKESDVWTPEDDLLFCQYCTSLRDKAYWMVARDTGCRRGEMVKIKIKDLHDKSKLRNQQTVTIRVNGKTGTGVVRVYRSYSFLKKWLSNGHPLPNVSNAPLFCGMGKKNMGRALKAGSISEIFADYKKVTFPKLLRDSSVPEEDKRKIEDLLKKPWNPHFRRHTAATEISKELKDPVLINQYFRWSNDSKTHLRYQHYGTNDAIAELDKLDGLVASDGVNKNNNDILNPIICASCGERNEPKSKYCSNPKCMIVLDWDTYNQSKEEAEKFAKETERTQKVLQDLVARQEEQEMALRGLIPFILDDKSEFHGITEVGEEIIDVKGELIGIVEKEEKNRQRTFTTGIKRENSCH